MLGAERHGPLDTTFPKPASNIKNQCIYYKTPWPREHDVPAVIPVLHADIAAVVVVGDEPYEHDDGGRGGGVTGGGIVD
jgi:hypothetical protein